MRKKLFLLSTFLLLCLVAGAQTKSVAVLGDSYSTFEGAIPEGNAIWYFKQNNPNQTDVNSVEQTWWTLLTKHQGWTLLMNNSYSGSTICNTAMARPTIATARLPNVWITWARTLMLS